MHRVLWGSMTELAEFIVFIVFMILFKFTNILFHQTNRTPLWPRGLLVTEWMRSTS